jgi:hypothetical protein
MLIPASIVNGSIARARRSRLDPSVIAKLLADGEKPRRVTPEQWSARYPTLVSQTGTDEGAHTLLERLIGGNDLVGIN